MHMHVILKGCEPPSSLDEQAAGIAISAGIALLTHNKRHFQQVPGLASA